MADQARERIGMPLSEWERRWDEHGSFELIDGEIIEVPPHQKQHNVLTKLFYDALFLYLLQNEGLGHVFAEATYALTEGSDWVKGSHIPDVMVYLGDRWERYTSAEDYDPENGPITLIPDIVIEIISHNDLFEDDNDKAEDYLAEGVQLVWIISPRKKTIFVKRKDSNYFKLTNGDTLTDPLLPGFALQVDKIFPTKKAK
jgi:Uma2 family endonuclease